MPVVNLLVDLDAPLFAQDDVHHAIEALDRVGGTYVYREHRTPERILAWIDAEFGGTLSLDAAAGGIWIAERAGKPVGFAAFDARGLRHHWLRAWTQRDGVGICGPLGIAEAARGGGIGRVLVRAALFSLRERGYRQALLPAVDDSGFLAFYEKYAGARVVENVDLGRRGRRFRTTVLASGNGSNFGAVAEAAATGTLPLEIGALVVDRADAFAKTRAREAGIAACDVLWNRGAESRDDYGVRLVDAVAATEPDLVLLLGWMHVLGAPFVARFPEMLNIHPAYLPIDPSAESVTMPDGAAIAVYRGARAFDDARAARSPWAGATTHRVSVAVDRGAVYARAPLRLDPGENRAAADERLHALERGVVAAAVRRWTWERR